MARPSVARMLMYSTVDSHAHTHAWLPVLYIPWQQNTVWYIFFWSSDTCVSTPRYKRMYRTLVTIISLWDGIEWIKASWGALVRESLASWDYLWGWLHRTEWSNAVKVKVEYAWGSPHANWQLCHCRLMRAWIVTNRRCIWLLGEFFFCSTNNTIKFVMISLSIRRRSGGKFGTSYRTACRFRFGVFHPHSALNWDSTRW